MLELSLELGVAVSYFLNHFVVWLFLMAAMFNFSKTSKVNLQTGGEACFRKELTLLSLVMFLSYLLSTHFQEFRVYLFYDYPVTRYSVYFIFELITIFVVYFFLDIKTKVGVISRFYLLVGMFINGSFFMAFHFMHYTYASANWVLSFPWLAETFFYVINAIDLIMFLSLVLTKDYIGLYRLRCILFNS